MVSLKRATQGTVSLGSAQSVHSCQTRGSMLHTSLADSRTWHHHHLTTAFIGMGMQQWGSSRLKTCIYYCLLKGIVSALQRTWENRTDKWDILKCHAMPYCMQCILHAVHIAWPYKGGCREQRGLWSAAQRITKLLWVHPGEAKPWEDCLQKGPLLLLCSLLFAVVCSCCIWHGVVTVKGSPLYLV